MIHTEASLIIISHSIVLFASLVSIILSISAWKKVVNLELSKVNNQNLQLNNELTETQKTILPASSQEKFLYILQEQRQIRDDIVNRNLIVTIDKLINHRENLNLIYQNITKQKNNLIEEYKKQTQQGKNTLILEQDINTLGQEEEKIKKSIDIVEKNINSLTDFQKDATLNKEAGDALRRKTSKRKHSK